MKRLQYIDVAKGVVILLVILGHLVAFNKLFWLWIFAFHMPFFFIMSGYCSSDKSYELNFKEYLMKYVKALLIPALLIRIIYLFVGVSGVDIHQQEWVHNAFLNFIHPLSEWFIMSLFLSKILFYFVHKLAGKFNDIRIRGGIYFFTVGLAFFVGETWNSNSFHGSPSWLPIPLDCSLIALSFVIAGYCFRKIDVADIYVKNKITLLCGGGVAALLILWAIKYQTYTNVCDMYFGNSSISYYIFACILSLVCLMLCGVFCEKTVENNIIKKELALLGRNTIIVYPGHTIIFYLLNQFIYKSTGILYVPMHNFKTSLIFIYFIISVLILTIICLCKEGMEKIDKLKKGYIAPIIIIVYFIFLSVNEIIYLHNMNIADENEQILEINSVDDFIQFRDSVNNGTDYQNWYIYQMVDLDLENIDNFTPIGIFGSENYFCGVYDGNGHSIRNLNINREDNCALFSVLGGTIYNLKIESGNIAGACVGSFASHATQDGNAKIINCINQASVYGKVRAGGIADNFNGEVINCINLGEITADSGETGGIISYSAVDVRNSLANSEPLYPKAFVLFENNCKIDGNVDLIRYSFLLGQEAYKNKIQLLPINDQEELIFSTNNSVFYYIGEIFGWIKEYVIDILAVVCIIGILIKGTNLCKNEKAMKQH